MSNSLLEFFTAINNQGGIVVKDAPKLDLDLYIQSYRGRTRFDRLLLIGQSSVALCVEALKAAVAEAKRGRDTHRYRDAVDSLRQAAPSEPEATIDPAWLSSQEAANDNETNRLVIELKGYKNNLIKESIRMGHEDLGKHYESIGELNSASEAFSKMRPDISTAKQLIEVGRHLVRVAIQRREWGMISPHLAKMALGGSYPDDEKALQPYLRIATGIAFLGMEKYPEAAQNFLAVDPSIPSSTYNEIASRNDVAIYGGLLALATMDRKELQANVLDNSPFRVFLELEPHIRKAVTYFVNGRYSACIETLEAYRTDYLLDIYLQKHISTIYAKIRSKCIVQYLIPFSCVTLDTMNKAFGSPEEPIEEELAAMIQAGVLDARINVIDRLVTTVRVDPRTKMQAEALASAENYERQAIDHLRRMGIVTADLELKSPAKMGIQSLNNPGDSFADDMVM